MATNGNLTEGAVQYPATMAHSADPNAENANLSKDEVGWYFVEQYYTTLSKSAEKLHLFYGKRSQFVYGMEGESSTVSVGRQAIQERIKKLDFQDCKVRISNVDSQASFENIVIQVIGETSNNNGEPKKFVQTFVLAQQPSGYFVLNDMLRYVNEDGDEEPVEPSGAAELPANEPQVPAVTEEASAAPEVEQVEAVPQKSTEPSQLDPSVVDKKLEDIGTTEGATSTAPSTIDTPAEASQELQEAAPEPAAPAEAAAAPDPEYTAQEIAEEDAKEPEKPKDPSPTPVPSRAPPAQVEPEKAQPPKPMTWASRAAAAAGPRPVVPLPKTGTPPATSQARAPVPAPPAQPAAAPTTTEAPKEPANAGNEWQTAGADSKRQNRPQSISGPPTDKEGTMGYVKYVTEKVNADDLKATLSKFGPLTYFDINRSKNCAFVEFQTQQGYNAATTANPHTVNGENIVVEPRRPKASAYGGTNYTTGRGNLSGRGRGGYEGGRASSQSGRGGFTGQNRGRGAPRGGRGSSAAANA